MAEAKKEQPKKVEAKKVEKIDVTRTDIVIIKDFNGLKKGDKKTVSKNVADILVSKKLAEIK